MLAEIRAGFRGTQQAHSELLLSRFPAKPTVSVLLPSEKSAEQYARLFVQLKRALITRDSTSIEFIS